MIEKEIDNELNTQSVVIADDSWWHGKYFKFMTSVEIPYGIKGIQNDAFAYCSELTSITIPSSVTSIGESAFFCCNGLTNVIIPNSVTSIEASAFRNCTRLTSISMPNSVSNIGACAFFGCTSTINCECMQADKPKDWDALWNGDNNNVNWGYTGK